MQGLAFTALLHQAAEQGAAAAVDIGDQPGIIADGHVTVLDGAETAVAVFADIDIAIVDIRADALPGGVGAVGDEVLHRADDAAQLILEAPQADVDDGRAVAFQRGDLNRIVLASGRDQVGFGDRLRGGDELRILLVAVENERLAHLALFDELVHVLHRGRITEGEADFGLQPFGGGQFMRLPGIAVIVADRFFAEAMGAGFQDGEGQVFVVIGVGGAGARADIDDIQVQSREQRLVIGEDVGDIELFGAMTGERFVAVADGDEVNEGAADEAGQVRPFRPAAGAEDRSSQFFGHGGLLILFYTRAT